MRGGDCSSLGGPSISELNNCFSPAHSCRLGELLGGLLWGSHALPEWRQTGLPGSCSDANQGAASSKLSSTEVCREAQTGQSSSLHREVSTQQGHMQGMGQAHRTKTQNGCKHGGDAGAAGVDGGSMEDATSWWVFTGPQRGQSMWRRQ